MYVDSSALHYEFSSDAQERAPAFFFRLCFAQCFDALYENAERSVTEREMRVTVQVLAWNVVRTAPAQRAVSPALLDIACATKATTALAVTC